MGNREKAIVWFNEVGKGDVALVGGKGANLGEMVNSKLPVPFGFIITAYSYFAFIKNARIEEKIKDIISIINYDNSHELQQASSQIKKLILEAEMPETLAHTIINYYEQLPIQESNRDSKKGKLLNSGIKNLRQLYSPEVVAVRSSATAEFRCG